MNSHAKLLNESVSLDVLNLSYDMGRVPLRELSEYVQASTPAPLLPLLPQIKAYVCAAVLLCCGLLHSANVLCVGGCCKSIPCEFPCA